MNVLFVKSSIGSSILPSFDMGIGLMSAILKQNNHKVNYFSFDTWEAEKSLITRIKTFKPKAIGISVTASTFASSVEVAKLIKENFPKVIIVLGGVHPTIFPECINASRSIDAICRGEGEYAFLNFINNLEKNDESFLTTQGFWVRDKKGNITKNPASSSLVDINTLPLPDRSIFLEEGVLSFPRDFKQDKFGLEFIFSRGCPFECTYCSNHALKSFYGPKFVRQKNPQLAIAEVKYVMEHYRYDFFRFHDDTFTLNKKWLDQFLNEYAKIKVPFWCNIRADVCTKETLKKMKDAGCQRVLIGIESGDDQIRLNVLNKKIKNSVFKQAFLWAKEVGLETEAFLLIGLPQETPQKFINTIKFLSEVESTQASLYVYYPYPGTKLYSECRQKGYLNQGYNQPNLREREDTILTMRQFSREDILYFYRNFDFLVGLARKNKKRKHGLKKMYGELMFFLLTQPPSSKYYLPSTIVSKCIYLLRSMANFSISLVLKVV